MAFGSTCARTASASGGFRVARRRADYRNRKFLQQCANTSLGLDSPSTISRSTVASSARQLHGQRQNGAQRQRAASGLINGSSRTLSPPSVATTRRNPAALATSCTASAAQRARCRLRHRDRCSPHREGIPVDDGSGYGTLLATSDRFDEFRKSSAAAERTSNVDLSSRRKACAGRTIIGVAPASRRAVASSVRRRTRCPQQQPDALHRGTPRATLTSRPQDGT